MKIWLVVVSLLVATLFWCVLFWLKPFNFWVEMTVAAVVLGGFAIWRRQSSLGMRRLGTPRAWLVGICSAGFLYLVFWAGKHLSTWIFPLRSLETSAIYAFREQSRDAETGNSSGLPRGLLRTAVLGDCIEKAG